MGAGEGGEHQLAHIGLPLADLHLGDPLVHVADFIDVGEVQLGVHALGVEVEGQGHHVHVAGALAIAEQGGLHPLGPGQQAQFSGSHALAPVVVGVQGDNGAVPAGQPGDKVLNFVSEVVGHTVLHGGGEVEDHLALRRGTDGLDHRLADLHGGVHLGAHEGLRGVLVPQIHPRVEGGLAQLPDEPGGVHGDLFYALHVGVEDHLLLEGGGGVVEVEDHMLGPVNGLEGAADEVLSGLYQHLDGHIVGDVSPLDQGADELVLRLGGGGEPHLDLLDADVHQGVKQLQLLPDVHGVNEGLVAVPQIHRAPDGGRFQLPVGPGAAGHLEGDEGDVLLVCGLHNNSSCLLGPGYEKTPLTKFLVRGVKFTRYHPASAHCHQGALMASNKAAAGNVAVTARPTAWGSDGRLRAQYPRASPRRFAPTTGSLSGTGRAFFPSLPVWDVIALILAGEREFVKRQFPCRGGRAPARWSGSFRPARSPRDSSPVGGCRTGWRCSPPGIPGRRRCRLPGNIPISCSGKGQ